MIYTIAAFPVISCLAGGRGGRGTGGEGWIKDWNNSNGCIEVGYATPIVIYATPPLASPYPKIIRYSQFHNIRTV